MAYPSFALYNIAGGVAWVTLCLGAGYLFGNVPVIKDNFSLVALGIVFVSLLPMAFEYFRHRARRLRADPVRVRLTRRTGRHDEELRQFVRM